MALIVGRVIHDRPQCRFRIRAAFRYTNTNPNHQSYMTNTENGAVPALNAPWRPRRGLRRADAAHYVGVSPSKFDRLVADGRMPAPIKLDGCTVWDMRQLDRAFDVLAQETEDANPWSQVTLQ